MKGVLKRAGLLPYAKAARTGWRAASESLDPIASTRDKLDNDHLNLLLAFLLAPDSNCIDVGCHEGKFLEHMLELSPAGKHYAFEPLPHMYAHLAQQFPNVELRNVALSNRQGTSTFTHVKTLPGYSGFRRRTYPGQQEIEEIEVQVVDLDSVLPPDYVPTLVKIDVEGAEYEVLSGAVATLSKHKPIVVFEHGLGAADHYGTTPTQVHDLLAIEVGLRIFDLDGNGPYSASQFEEAFYANERWNFVAHR